MGNLVYPTLPGRSLPSGRTILPPKVRVRTTPSDREFRSRDALLPRYQYSLSYEWLRTKAASPELQTLLGFYNQVGGPFDSFLYLDPDDNTVSAQSFGIGDGTTTSFQLLRSFGGFAEPVSAVVAPPAVLVAGVQAGNVVAPYGSFETDTNADGIADGWSRYSSGTPGTLTAALTTGMVVAGSKCQSLSASALPSSGGEHGLQRLAVNAVELAGQAVTLSASIAANGGTRAQLAAVWKDGSGSTISTLMVDILATGSQQDISASGTCPGGARSVDLYVYQYAGSGGSGTLLVDAVQLETGSTVQPFSDNLATVPAGTGTVVFAAPPASGAALTWAGQFYRRCRFMGDKLDTDKFMAGLFNAKRVEFISTKG